METARAVARPEMPARPLCERLKDTLRLARLHPLWLQAFLAHSARARTVHSPPLLPAELPAASTSSPAGSASAAAPLPRLLELQLQG